MLASHRICPRLQKVSILLLQVIGILNFEVLYSNVLLQGERKFVALRTWQVGGFRRDIDAFATAQLVPWSCGQGDGVLLMIFLNTRAVYVNNIHGSDCLVHDIHLRLQVTNGDVLAFALDPKSTDHYDGTLLDIRIYDAT
jgi:hypothetical protein